MKDFTELNAWKFSHDLVLTIYKLTEKFPKLEKFGLTSQMQRASVSITSNIAEGFGRQSYKEKLQFYYIAHGSLTELKNQLILCSDLNYINKQEYNNIMDKVDLSQKILQGLIKSSKLYIITKP